MRINRGRKEFKFDKETQQEMFILIKRLAFCEPFEFEGLRERANRILENTFYR